MEFEIVDVSAERLGKYQHCILDQKTGLWFADQDFDRGYHRSPKRGALPKPRQDTPQLTEKALAMHQEAADRLANSVLRPRGVGGSRRGLFARIIKKLGLRGSI